MSHEGTAADVNHRLPGRSQLHAAVANLKATNDELRMFAENLKEEGKQQQKEVMKERKVKVRVRTAMLKTQQQQQTL